MFQKGNVRNTSTAYRTQLELYRDIDIYFNSVIAQVTISFYKRQPSHISFQMFLLHKT